MRKIFITLSLLYGINFFSEDWNKWVSGYIASWNLNMEVGASNYGNQPYEEIDLDAMTHLIMFNASLDSLGKMNVKKEWDNTLTWGSTLLSQRRKLFNEYVHSKGKCIILTIFGEGGGGNWTKMVSNPTYRRNAIRTIIDSVILGAKYDGVDLDIEPLTNVDTANTRLFIQELYDTLQKYHAWYDRTKKPLLTAAVYTVPEFWARVAQYFAQVNIMTYDMDGLWTTKTWHNCPVYTAGATDIYGNPLTSIYSKTKKWKDDYGIPKERLGCGVSTYAKIWRGGRLKNDPNNGVTAPLQEWDPDYPPIKVYYWGKEYYWLKKNYLDTATGTLHYDEPRKCPYIGRDSIGNEGDIYITFADTSTMKEVVNLVDTMDIGGFIFYDVPAQYLNKKDFPSVNERNPLLNAVKIHAKNKLIPDLPKGFLKASKTLLPENGDTVTLSWTSENATSASLDFGGDSIKSVALNGSVIVNVKNTKTFTLTLSNQIGTIHCFRDIVVEGSSGLVLEDTTKGEFFQLGQNYPNPFNSFTYIPFKVFQKTKVKLYIYDICGRVISVLLDEEKDKGDYEVKIDLSKIGNKKNLPAGIYYYNLQAGNISKSKSMLYLK